MSFLMGFTAIVVGGTHAAGSYPSRATIFPSGVTQMSDAPAGVSDHTYPWVRKTASGLRYSSP